MDKCSSSNTLVAGKSSEEKETDDAGSEEFQKNIIKLFERNGVINDLRAHLRGQIVNVIKSTQTGEFNISQKNLKQRLEPTYQAINILMVEYLMRHNFKYSLSVYVSEIPLAEMQYHFSKTLMQKTLDSGDELSAMRFQDRDIWFIMSHLGMPCEAASANSVVESYRKNNELSLLACILSSRFAPSPCTDDEKALSPRPPRDGSPVTRCVHLAVCRACQARFNTLAEKYRGEKKNAAKHNQRAIRSDVTLRRMELLEKDLVDEANTVQSATAIDQQMQNNIISELRAVYEAEVDSIRGAQQSRLRRALDSCAAQLRRRSDELEHSFSQREAALRDELASKRRLLCELARSLRRRLAAVAAAAADHGEKEAQLQREIANAEANLKTNAERLTAKFSTEIATLGDSLARLKAERQALEREKRSLEHLRAVHENSVKNNTTSLENHFLTIKSEIGKLRSFMDEKDSVKTTTSDKATMTDGGKTPNRPVYTMTDAKMCRQVNCFKKDVNVSGSQDGKLPGRPAPGRPGAAPADGVRALREDNARLRLLAEQQAAYIERVSSQRARLASALEEARAALRPDRPTDRPTDHPTDRPVAARGRSDHDLYRRTNQSFVTRTCTGDPAFAAAERDLMETPNACSLSWSPTKILRKDVTSKLKRPAAARAGGAALREARRALRSLEAQAEAAADCYGQYRRRAALAPDASRKQISEKTTKAPRNGREADNKPKRNDERPPGHFMSADFTELNRTVVVNYLETPLNEFRKHYKTSMGTDLGEKLARQKVDSNIFDNIAEKNMTECVKDKLEVNKKYDTKQAMFNVDDYVDSLLANIENVQVDEDDKKMTDHKIHIGKKNNNDVPEDPVVKNVQVDDGIKKPTDNILDIHKKLNNDVPDDQVVVNERAKADKTQKTVGETSTKDLVEVLDKMTETAKPEDASTEARKEELDKTLPVAESVANESDDKHNESELITEGNDINNEELGNICSASQTVDSVAKLNQENTDSAQIQRNIKEIFVIDTPLSSSVINEPDNQENALQKKSDTVTHASLSSVGYTVETFESENSETKVTNKNNIIFHIDNTPVTEDDKKSDYIVFMETRVDLSPNGSDNRSVVLSPLAQTGKGNDNCDSQVQVQSAAESDLPQEYPDDFTPGSPSPPSLASTLTDSDNFWK